MISPELFLKGIFKNLPGINKLTNSIKNTGGGATDNSRYCYSIWLRHLYFAHKTGLKDIPSKILEIGPGNSLGTGIAALLCGVNEYYAIDVSSYGNAKKNIQILKEVIDLFKKREKIPGPDEFPKIKPQIKKYDFPKHILSDTHLKKTLDAERINSIQNALLNKDAEKIKIKQFIAGNNLKIPKVDMIYSQAVLEHVNNLDKIYENFSKWLKPKGFMSHAIDFQCHKTAKDWNGHWTYSDFEWRLIKGRDKFFINRAPYSAHINLLNKHGFKITGNIKTKLKSKIQRKELAPRFKNLSDADLTTSVCFIQAKKNN